jgi:hypothetical protein
MKAHILLKAAILLCLLAPPAVAAQASAPVVSPGTGSYFDSVDVSLYTATVGGTIYYTTDGTVPTNADTPFTFPFTLTESTVVKAITIKSGDTDSLVSTAVINITDTPEDVVPTLSLIGKKSLKTTKPTIKIRGTSTGADSVEYQIGDGDFKTAQGTDAWSLKAKLKPGKNVITIYGIGEFEDSDPLTVTVTLTRKK